MGEHYFSRRPTSRRQPIEFRSVLRGQEFRFVTEAGTFSRTRIDRGTELLIEALDVRPGDTLLDLGCGYGAIGTVAARLADGGHVVLTDVNERAVTVAEKNLTRNQIGNAEVRRGDLYDPVEGLAFDHIVCNPPIRAGRAIVDRIVKEAPEHLREGGSLWFVARTKQGADAIRSRMEAAFGNVRIAKRGSGYKVLRSTKRRREDPGDPWRKPLKSDM